MGNHKWIVQKRTFAGMHGDVCFRKLIAFETKQQCVDYLNAIQDCVFMSKDVNGFSYYIPRDVIMYHSATTLTVFRVGKAY